MPVIFHAGYTQLPESLILSKCIGITSLTAGMDSRYFGHIRPTASLGYRPTGLGHTVSENNVPGSGTYLLSGGEKSQMPGEEAGLAGGRIVLGFNRVAVK